MFFKKSKREKISIHSPLHAELIPLGRVPDPVFSQKMMGEGFGFIPVKGEVVSPVDGKVTNVFPTKHAIGLITAEGLEVLLHLGLETVGLKGEGFEIQVKEGDKVRINQPLGTFDLDFIKRSGKETTSVLVFPNFEEKISDFTPLTGGSVGTGTEIAQFTVK